MWQALGINEADWEATPPALRTLLLTQQHQIRLLEIRCVAYEKERALLHEQVTQIENLKAEIAELRERLGRNSNNSSQPPSADAAQSRHAPRRERSGRKRGAQRGHTGAGRKLKALAEVDQVIELRPTSCGACGSLLLGTDPQPARHQVSEIPPVKAQVTEYQRHTLSCLACGAQTTADWPPDMPVSSFGSRVQAVVGYLSGRLGTSQRDLAEVLEALFGLTISLGSVSALQQRVSTVLAAPVQALYRFAQTQRVQYVDETSWPESAQAKWLWINATKDVTAFHLLGKRNAQAAQTVIDTKAKGIITSDRYSGYQWLPKRRRQICWAHLKRDFQALAERGGDSATVGLQLLTKVKELFKEWHQLRAGALSRRSFQRRCAALKEKIKQLLEQGSGVSHRKTRHTCQQILKVWEALWTFVRVEGIEPTNNNAERPLRRAVLWRRKSFGTQSATGSQFVARILTVITTLCQQGRSVLEYLTQACAAALTQEQSTGLLP